MRNSTAQNLVSHFRLAARLTPLRSLSASASSKKKLTSSHFTKKKTHPNADSQKKLSSSNSSSSKKKFTSSPATAAKGKKPSSNLTKKKSSSADNGKTLSSSASNDVALVKHLSAINVSSFSLSHAKSLLKNFKAPSTWTDSPSTKGDDDYTVNLLSTKSSDEMYLSWDDESEDESDIEPAFDFPRISYSVNSMRRNDFSRTRRQQCVYKNRQPNKYGNLFKMCAMKLGADAAVDVFGKLGKEAGVNDCNAMIKVCMENATTDTAEENVTTQLGKVIWILQFMREKGFEIQEGSYGQFLMYLVDGGMVDEFVSIREFLQEANPDAFPRLAYYEMLLWISVGNEVKIRELCQSSVGDDAVEGSHEFQEQLLLALCEGDYKEDFLMLLGVLDITAVMSFEHLECIFRTLGKFLLEKYADNFLLSLKRNGIADAYISNFICEYATNTPNLAVVDVVEKFQTLHNKLEVLPTLDQYEKLIRYCCESFKVHEALALVDRVLESGAALSLEAFHLILDACDRSYEYNLVHRIALSISSSPVKPNNETFRKMILLCVKMKDYEGAYRLIDDLQTMNLTLTATMYNQILLGYVREKNMERANNVIRQMEVADVKPDSVTYSYLIGSCQNVKDINKIYDKMIESRIMPTTQFFIATINAYTACGLFEKAKKVILDERIPKKDLPKVKSVLVGTLASSGQFSEALQMYEEIKEAKCYLNVKTLRTLVDHFLSNGDFSKLLQLMEELQHSPHWTDACFWVISHCVDEENLSLTVDLLKKLKDRFNHTIQLEVLFDEVFNFYAENKASNIQFGLSLLRAIKEELGVFPSRKSLDFLLTACVAAKDSEAAILIWKEYEIAGLPYNALTYLRMLQALLVSGDKMSAEKIVNQMPKGDIHVRHIVQVCYKIYDKCESVQKRKKKEKRALVTTLGLLDTFKSKLSDE